MGGGVSGWWVVVVSALVGVSGVDEQFFNRGPVVGGEHSKQVFDDLHCGVTVV